MSERGDGGAGRMGPGQDFQAMRQKARAGRLVPPARKTDGGRAGTMAADLYANRIVPVPRGAAPVGISSTPASNQNNYGAHREKIRTIPGMRGWGR